MGTKNKNWVWLINLIPNNLLDDEGHKSYYASFYKTRKTFYLTDICEDAAAEPGCPFTAETLYECAKRVSRVAREKCCAGNIVVMENEIYTPSANGVYSAIGELISEEDTGAMVNITPTSNFKNDLARVSLSVNNVVDLGGAEITKLTDLDTLLTDGSATRGQMLCIEGKKIRCLKQDGSVGKVKLYNESDEVTEVKPGINDPSKVVIVVPNDLAEGTYRIEIETYFSSSSTLLKECRTIISPILMKIG